MLAAVFFTLTRLRAERRSPSHEKASLTCAGKREQSEVHVGLRCMHEAHQFSSSWAQDWSCAAVLGLQFCVDRAVTNTAMSASAMPSPPATSSHPPSPHILHPIPSCRHPDACRCAVCASFSMAEGRLHLLCYKTRLTVQERHPSFCTLH